MNMLQHFERGNLISSYASLQSGEETFVPHKSFKGVSLKRLVGGDQTGGNLSVHLVIVDPGCCLETHTHPDNLEVHEVIGGSAWATIGGNIGEYRVGSVGVIPAGAAHKVAAGDQGLCMLATFSPALA